MGRWADYEDDSNRLPDGFERVGYDADTQTYTYREAHTGRYYEGAPGNRYGVLNPVSSSSRQRAADLTPAEVESKNAAVDKSNKDAVRLMLPFALLVLVSLGLLFKFLNSGAGAGADDAHQIHCAEGYRTIEISKKGETCWSTAEAHGLGVDELLKIDGNEKIDCDRLQLGQQICVPV